MIPAALLDLLAGVMLTVAALSLARLTAARLRPGGPAATRADVDGAHLLMAIAMAGMLTRDLRTLPDTAWAVIFALLTAWFADRVRHDARGSGWRALAGGHAAPHLIHAASMLYMVLAVTAPVPGAMAGMGRAGMGTVTDPLVALTLALLLAGYCVWDLDQLSGPGPSLHDTLAGQPTPATPAAALAAGTPAVIPARLAGQGVLAPGLAVSCRIAMGATMAFMLVIMI